MSEIERDELEVDVLFVGAGPGCLAGAIRLGQLLEEHGKSEDDVTVVVIEKAAEVGFHSLSGAVMAPRALSELLPDYRDRGCPIEADVQHDEIWYLHERDKQKVPFVPPSMRNEGCHVISLGRLTAWMAEQMEETGRVDLFTETAGAQILYDGDRVIGVRCGDKGVDKDGNPKANFEPGIDILAKITILGEGARGSLAKPLIPKLRLDADSAPQVYSLGIKELWQMPPGSVRPGQVIHTMGWPFKDDVFGGAFVYTMADDIVDVGLVVGLDYHDPNLEPHKLFQQFKTHPSIRGLIEGGKMIQYGAKALPEGGLHTVPRVSGNGVMLVGDTASLLNPMRLKGIHTAMKSGMLAAETAFHALEHDDCSADALSAYQSGLNGSWVTEELRTSRNFHAGFEHGNVAGLLNAGMLLVTNGLGILGEGAKKAGHSRMQTLAAYDTDLCVTRCTNEYGNPCTRFCPAQVYNIVDDEAAATGTRLQIDFSNCVHCKTCDIMDPYEVITWVPPEGGDGPRYDRL